ncbi:MAG: hypothetical protein AABX79_02260 [Nanoarchaeota archaeon]
MKSLKPSMRENKRYLLVKGNVGDIEKAILEAIGILGMSKIGLGWIKREKDAAVISINRESMNDVRASFALWPSELQVKMVSGSLKKLKK